MKICHAGVTIPREGTDIRATKPRIASTKPRLIGGVGAAMFLLACLSGCATTQREAKLTAQERLRNVESFDYVWSTIRDKHWDQELVGPKWESARDEFRPAVEKAATMSQARSSMRQLINCLGQTHFGIVPSEVYDEDDLGGSEGRDGDMGIDVRIVDGQAVVVSAYKDGTGYKADVRPGWVVTHIDGDEIAPRLTRLSERFEGKTLKNLVLARSVMNRLHGARDESREVQFLDERDRPVTKMIPLGTPRGRRMKFGNMPGMHVWIESRTLEGDVAYLRLSSFFDPVRVMGVINKTLRASMDARGVVIDLRGNPGGIGAMSMGVAGWLVRDKGKYLGTMYTRDTTLKFVINPRGKVFAGPVAILVDGLTGSTSEILAGGLQDLGRAQVIGTRTAGAALPSVFERLPNGDGFQYAIANYISAGGEALEGSGVEPDVEVSPTRAAILDGRDPALEEALAWIGEQ